MRGNVNLTDLNRNAQRMSRMLDLAPWDTFKVGHCAVAPRGHPHSLLFLSNNSCVTDQFASMESRFRSLYGPRRKAYLHHYLQYAEQDEFDTALDTLVSLQQDYRQAALLLDTYQPPQRFKIL